MLSKGLRSHASSCAKKGHFCKTKPLSPRAGGKLHGNLAGGSLSHRVSNLFSEFIEFIGGGAK
jgi:hypothetical protein